MVDVAANADVGMIQAGDRFCFALEALAQLGTIRKMRRQHFDSNNAIEPRVVCLIDFAHPACTNLREDIVGAETCAARDHHASPTNSEWVKYTP